MAVRADTSTRPPPSRTYAREAPSGPPPGPTGEPRSRSGDGVRLRPRRYSPILPFLGVLFRGADAPLFLRRDALLAPETPSYHPSVGYARDIYVAIAMNAAVDLFGFTYLFHSYFTGWSSAALAWTVSLGLGAVFATAFATFATSLVRKPLRTPRARWRTLKVTGAVGVVGAVAVICGGALGAGAVPEILRGVGWLAVAGASLASLFSAFGFQDGAMLVTRAAVMLGVGYLVAGPLHEAMFYQEIEQAHRERAMADTATHRDGIRARVAEIQAASFASCMRARSVPVEPTCAQPRAERERAELLVQAIAFVKSEEKSGRSASATRDYLLDSARKLDATAVVALLGTPGSASAKDNPRYQQAMAMQGEARKLAQTARSLEDTCVGAAAACELAAGQDPEVAALARQLGVLEADAGAVAEGGTSPGAIDRAIALERVISGDGAADGARRASLLQGKLLAAWFLAMVMPVIVLAMKVSAGDKLEPYLRKRWGGR